MECVCTRKHVEALREETTIADLTLCVGVNHHTPEEERERGEGGRERRVGDELMLMAAMMHSYILVPNVLDVSTNVSGTVSGRLHLSLEVINVCIVL